jgi:hypothetical protein
VWGETRYSVFHPSYDRSYSAVMSAGHASLPRALLAALLGVRRHSVRLCEQHSTVPRDPDLRRRVADLLGAWPWLDQPPLDPAA